MGLLDYIKANTPRATTPRAKPGTVIREGLLNPNQFNAPAANRFKDSLFGLAGVVPGVGDIASGVEAADYWNRGEKGNAGLAALGMLPFVPALGGMVKKADSGLLGDAVFYHGSVSKEPFLEFDPAKLNTGSGVSAGAFWFTPSKNYAKKYADRLGKNTGTVIPVNIKAEKVLNLDKTRGKYSTEAKKIIDTTPSNKTVYEHAFDSGYDAVVSMKGNEIAVRDPNKIKTLRKN